MTRLPDAQETKIGDAGGFLHHLEVQRRPVNHCDREIGAIDGNAVPQTYACHERAAVNGKLHHFAAGTHRYDGTDVFYNACKHTPSNVDGLTIGIAHGLHNGLGQCRMRMHGF